MAHPGNVWYNACDTFSYITLVYLHIRFSNQKLILILNAYKIFSYNNKNCNPPNNKPEMPMITIKGAFIMELWTKSRSYSLLRVTVKIQMPSSIINYRRYSLMKTFTNIANGNLQNDNRTREHTFFAVGITTNMFRPISRPTEWIFSSFVNTLRWRHNDHESVSNHQPHGCLLNRLFRRRSKKTSKFSVTGLCAGNSPGHKGPVTRKMFPFDYVIMIILFAKINWKGEILPINLTHLLRSYKIFDDV